MIPFRLKMDFDGRRSSNRRNLKAAYDTERSTRELIETALILEDITRKRFRPRRRRCHWATSRW